MNYESPRLFSLENEFGSPVCNPGSSAGGNNCIDGPSVSRWCAPGNSDGACADGTAADLCGGGVSGGGAVCLGGASPDYTRCISGTSVS